MIQSSPDVTNLYLSIVPVLILLPFFGQWRNRYYRFFFIAGIIAGLLSFSVTISHIAFQFLPGFGISPLPPITIFFLCLLVSFGLSLDHILKHNDIISPMRMAFLIIAIILLSALPPAVAALKNQFDGFAPNYIAFLISWALFLTALLIRQYKRNKIFFTAIVAVVIAVNILPLMKRQVTFYGPDGSWGLRCKYAREMNADDEYDRPRYFDATGTAFLLSNTNIYPRLRLVQGYDSLVLRSFVDEYQKHLPSGVFGGRIIITKSNRAPLDYLKIAGVGKIILNPVGETEGIWEKAGDTDISVKDVAFPECAITSGQSPITTAQCAMHRIRPELIEIDIDAAATADLYIAEAYYPAWRYRLDANPHVYKVLQSDEGFMIIPDIPPGAKKVTLFYDPYLERLGLILASASFISGFALISWLDKRAHIPAAHLPE